LPLARKRTPGSHFDGPHGLRTSQGCGRPRQVLAPRRCAPRHIPWRRDAANFLSSSSVPPLAFLANPALLHARRARRSGVTSIFALCADIAVLWKCRPLGVGALSHTHTTIATSPTNAAAVIAAKHRSIESKLKPGTSKALGLPALANICRLPEHGAASRQLCRER
jgi:hypothetical protein